MARDVYRIVSQISQNASDTASYVLLHEADVAKTLIRTLVELSLTNNTTTSEDITLRYAIIPEDFAVPSLDHVQNLDDDIPDEFIMYVGKTVGSDGTAAHHVHQFFKDIKSMRIMDPGDSLILQYICQTASGVGVFGTVTMFFKDS